MVDGREIIYMQRIRSIEDYISLIHPLIYFISKRSEPVRLVPVLAQEQAAGLSVQILNHLNALSNTFVRLDLPLESWLHCLELRQHKFIRLNYSGGFLPCENVSMYSSIYSESIMATYRYPMYQPIQGSKQAP